MRFTVIRGVKRGKPHAGLELAIHPVAPSMDNPARGVFHDRTAHAIGFRGIGVIGKFPGGDLRLAMHLLGGRLRGVDAGGRELRVTRGAKGRGNQQ